MQTCLLYFLFHFNITAINCFYLSRHRLLNVKEVYSTKALGSGEQMRSLEHGPSFST